MKTWWNILICMWISVIHRAVHVNGDFVLTSSPLIPTDGELFTLTCSIRNESTINIGWLQNNKPKVVTQQSPNCVKHPLAYGQDIINRINVSCSTTAHSMTFRFSSTTDQGTAWQCGKQVTDYDIHPRSNIYTIDVAGSVMSTQSLSTTTRSTAISSETVTLKKDVVRPVMSTQSTSTTTRYMETTSDPETVSPTKGTSSQTSTRNPENEEMDIEGYSSLDQISGPAQDSSIDKEGSEKQHHQPLKIYERTNVEAEAETSTYDNLSETPPVSYESIRASPYQNSGAQ